MEKTTAMEQIIQLVTTLITLSLVSERVINWVKLYFGQPGKALWGFSKRGEDLTKRLADPKANTVRDRKVLGLNIFICVLVAIVMHANLFDILGSDHPVEHLGWEGVHLFEGEKHSLFRLFQTILGCTLSGFCMSLGTKFWHDVMKLLIAVKGKKTPNQNID